MKTVKYITLILIAAYSFNSCKYFKKPPVEQIDTVTYQEVVDTFIIDTTPAPVIDKEVYMLEEIDSKYLIVVGSFETLKYAKQHAEKYKYFGYLTKVISKPDGFYMVSAQEFNDYNTAHKELLDFRNKIAKKSWVYINQRAVDQASIY